jgi:hypothetical protein
MSDPSDCDGEASWDKHVRSQTHGPGYRVRPLPKRPRSKVQEVERDPAVFARNLRSLIQHSGLTAGDAPTQIGVNRRWLRRLSSCGLARIDRRTRPDLEKIVRYFDLRGPEVLWEADLPQLRRQPAVDQQILGWREKVNWPYAQRLLELLETGDHEFLKGLIDSLYDSELLLHRGEGGQQPIVRSNLAAGLKRRRDRSMPPTV